MAMLVITRGYMNHDHRAHLSVTIHMTCLGVFAAFLETPSVRKNETRTPRLRPENAPFWDPGKRWLCDVWNLLICHG